MGISCELPDKMASLEERMDVFLRDRMTDSIMGVRRMGREELVRYACMRAASMGIKASIYPDADEGTELVLFYQRSDMKDASGLPAGADIVFGQDMCHQYPALVRTSNLK